MPHPPSEDEGARLRLHRLAVARPRDDFAEDVRRGLTAERKFLPPKYFYDELGSLLFEAICRLPEYYLTRAESEIFARRAEEIADEAARGSSVTLFELGSGSATKTRRVIEALLRRQPRLTYVPVDISTHALEESARALLQDYDALTVSAYAGDYDSALPRLPENLDDTSRALVLFLGSNVGNFDPTEAEDFLSRLRAVLRDGDALLLGADLKKERARLEAAYDDALGVTAAFNLNLLARLNQEFGADFDPRAFRHRAVYNETQGRVELYLVSRRAQVVRLPALDLEIIFANGEPIHTENSYKYDSADLDRLAARTGFQRTRTWLDSGRQFSSNLFVARS